MTSNEDLLEKIFTQLEIATWHKCTYGCNNPCPYQERAALAEELLELMEDYGWDTK